jgi:DNA polymerase-1
MIERVFDVETTTSNKGNPFDQTNKLVCIAYHDYNDTGCIHSDAFESAGIQSKIDEARLIIGFNFKFDYHWMRKAGYDLSHSRIWDCQLAEFLINNQIGAMPSLDECLAAHDLPLKIDVVKEEYWKKGIDTDQIPWEILSEYAKTDCVRTYQLYQSQQNKMSLAKQKLLMLQCQDLHILEEMEWNGLKFDIKLCEERASEISKNIEAIHSELNSIYPDVPINFNSPQQLSAFLYGGVISEEGKEHIGFYKSGVKAGQPKYKNITIEHILPRMYQPLRGSEMVKEGVYSTDEGTLKKLKGKKHIVNLLLELAKQSKLNETYYVGLPKLNDSMNWPEKYLHGQFNQTVAVTGRLSSSRPNLQNFASELQDIFVTRY